MKGKERGGRKDKREILMKYKRWGGGRGIMKYRKTGTEKLKLGKRL